MILQHLLFGCLVCITLFSPLCAMEKNKENVVPGYIFENYMIEHDTLVEVGATGFYAAINKNTIILGTLNNPKKEYRTQQIEFGCEFNYGNNSLTALTGQRIVGTNKVLFAFGDSNGHCFLCTWNGKAKSGLKILDEKHGYPLANGDNTWIKDKAIVEIRICITKNAQEILIKQADSINWHAKVLSTKLLEKLYKKK